MTIHPHPTAAIRFPGPGTCRLVACLAALAIRPAARAESGVDGVTAVSSKVTSDYVRERLPDGKFKPEYYSFGEGGQWAGQIRDQSLDKLSFIDVAKVIAAPMAARNYVPATDPKTTRLLVMVYWGMTFVPGATSSSAAYLNLSSIQNVVDQAQGAANAAASSSPASKGAGFQGTNSGNSNATSGMRDDQLSALSSAMIMLNMENRQRDRTDFQNAKLLGYDSPGLLGTEQGQYARGTALAIDRSDLITEIEENRYFVVLMAYDFQEMWKHKKHKLLWETRFSISQRHNEFDKALPAMARYASRYFGEASNGLLRARALDGNVEIGEPTVIEFLPEEKK